MLSGRAVHSDSLVLLERLWLWLECFPQARMTAPVSPGSGDHLSSQSMGLLYPMPIQPHVQDKGQVSGALAITLWGMYDIGCSFGPSPLRHTSQARHLGNGLDLGGA